MPHLILVRDVLTGGRAIHELAPGAPLSRELMRLFPEGFEGPWQLYKGAVFPECELAAADLPNLAVEDVDYVLVVRPAGPLVAGVNWLQLLYAFLISAAIGVITYFMTPRPKLKSDTNQESQDSPNNQIAGQTNQLRAGARVPDVLGRMRCYPDLLTYPAETWTWPNTQYIIQFFVLGIGDYEIADLCLGDTPITSIGGTSPVQYHPGQTVPEIECLRRAPTVDNLSLDAVLGGSSVPASNLTFIASTKTLSSPTRIPFEVGVPFNVFGTLYNDGDYFVETIPPPDQTTGPYLYTLDGEVQDEPAANPTAMTMYEPWGYGYPWTGTSASGNTYEIAGQIYFDEPEMYNPSPGAITGYLIEVMRGATRWRGHATEAWYSYDEPTTNVLSTFIWVSTDLYDDAIDFDPPWTIQYDPVPYRLWRLPIGSLIGVLAPRTDPVTPLPTGWMVSPLRDPEELWIDIAFPSGLVHFSEGVTNFFEVTIKVEFHRVGTPEEDVVEITLNPFVSNRTQYLRRTDKIVVADLVTAGLTGTAPIEVRLTRMTPIPVEDDTNQYVHESRWVSFRAMKRTPSRTYDDLTVIQLGLQNSRAASSLGENAFNLIATRILPTWTGTALTTIPAATERWADNLVRRMMAADGAAKDVSEIDMVGIYAIQDQLDDMDIPEGETLGDQGKISVTLDQVQDIDTELQLIAGIVRASVYRIGRKLYVTRDQGGKTPIALFTGRSKHPDGEQVSLSIKNDSEPDCVIVQWFDRTNGWKIREYQYPPPDLVTPLNELRLAPPFANWAQAYRRAVFEWNRLRLRRETINVQTTEEGRLMHVGDVINVTDDVANLAQSAGEIIEVDDLALRLDKPTDLSAGGYSITLRGVNGRDLDTMTVTQGADLLHVVLERAPLSEIELKGRDDSLGSMYAIYQSANAVVRPWLVTGIEPDKVYTRLVASNWREDVYAGDTGDIAVAPLMMRREARR